MRRCFFSLGGATKFFFFRAETPENAKGPPPPRHYGWHDSEELRRKAGLKCADLIGRANKNAVDCRDATFHVFGGKRMNEGSPHNSPHAVKHATHYQQADRQPKVGRQAKADHAQTETGDAPQQDFSDILANWIMGYENRHENGSDRRSSAQ